jgi:hypothetical protein
VNRNILQRIPLHVLAENICRSGVGFKRVHKRLWIQSLKKERSQPYVGSAVKNDRRVILSLEEVLSLKEDLISDDSE